MKPRCRWRIGVDQGVKPAPYRLEASLAENRRVDGKVQQEHVVSLGTIDAHLLPFFWNRLDPEVLAKARSEDWELRSIRARQAFWEATKPRLGRLGTDWGT
jgi:hypothetical protein